MAISNLLSLNLPTKLPSTGSLATKTSSPLARTTGDYRNAIGNRVSGGVPQANTSVPLGTTTSPLVSTPQVNTTGNTGVTTANLGGATQSSPAALYDSTTGGRTAAGVAAGSPDMLGGKPVVAPQQTTETAGSKGLFQTVTSSLANRGTTPNQPAIEYTAAGAGYGAQSAQTGQQAIDIAKQFGQKYADIGQAGAKFQAGQLTTGTTPVAEGNAAVTARTTAAQQTALAQGQQAALQGIGYQQAGLSQAAGAQQAAAGQTYTGQGQQISALGTAAGYAAPTQVGYNVQYTDPTTGQPYGGGATGGSLQSAVDTVTQQLQSGQIGYEAAKAQLSGYGQGGLNALSDWAAKNNFNIAQSDVLAGQQGSIKPAFEYAKIALSNLQSSLGNLMAGQSTNIPIINSITQGMSTTFGVGSEAVQNYKAAIAEARNAIQKVLASVQGGTPTDYVGQSNALLPDNATPNQINAAQSTLETLGTAKVGIYGNPGAAAGTNTNQNAPSNNNTLFSW
jgi:hypothetical protein